MSQDVTCPFCLKKLKGELSKASNDLTVIRIPKHIKDARPCPGGTCCMVATK